MLHRTGISKTTIKLWSSYFSTWLVNGTRWGHPVHVVKYEDLKSDTLGEVKKMLYFLQFHYEEEDLRKRLAGYNFDAFHRYMCILQSVHNTITPVSWVTTHIFITLNWFLCTWAFTCNYQSKMLKRH